ncbi:hypothetical protein HMI54_008330 [Coelomomyces lativittatus]|nr:hypothetical protein HMI56_006141 [Coelomomyces lativittatus]KAJ1512179.1 hypothetical protein HMI55_006328 [Coelomomyces lativittatus]KAJ1516764.1 hypothetical protein HMI54_008330 [Coelomomyces lativittatus]
MLGNGVPVAILNVTVIQAEDLPRADLIGNNDVYVKLSVNKPVKEAVKESKDSEDDDPQKMPLYQMTQISSSKNPIWNESFSLPVYSRPCTLFMEVYDDDYGRDDFLGEANCVVDSDKETVHDLWLDLNPGRIHVLLQYMPRSFLDNVNFKFNTKASELKAKMTKKLVNGVADFAANKIKGSF